MYMDDKTRNYTMDKGTLDFLAGRLERISVILDRLYDRGYDRKSIQDARSYLLDTRNVLGGMELEDTWSELEELKNRLACYNGNTERG